MVDYEILINDQWAALPKGKHYSVLDSARVTLFPEYETIFQHMIESFKGNNILLEEIRPNS